MPLFVQFFFPTSPLVVGNVGNVQVMNRDYGGLDALGSKHVAPWQTDQDRWPLDSLVGIRFFFTREK